MNNQFSNQSYNISILQDLSYIIACCKNHTHLFKISAVGIGQPSSMWQTDTDRVLIQIHVTFCEYLVVKCSA